MRIGCQYRRAFTLVEMLTVIAIIGILAAVVGPSIINFRKGDLTATATRQLIDDISRARQLAISQRTTVYMVFVPANFWQSGAGVPYNPDFLTDAKLTVPDRIAATNIAELQLVGYNYVSLRSLADQPGQQTTRYLSEWRSLPDGVFIPVQKFATPARWANQPYVIRTNTVNTNSTLGYPIHGFALTNSIPFPLATTVGPSYPWLPYLAFDYSGRLISEVDASGNYFDAYIPLAHGSVLPMRGLNGLAETRLPLPPGTPDALENPPGNSTNLYNIIHVDWLTGRARLLTREIE